MKYLLLFLNSCCVLSLLAQDVRTESLAVESPKYADAGKCYVYRWEPTKLKDTVYLSQVLLLADNQHILDEIGEYKIAYKKVTSLPKRDTLIHLKRREYTYEYVDSVFMLKSLSRRILSTENEPKVVRSIWDKNVENTPDKFFNTPIYRDSIQVGDTIAAPIALSTYNEKWVKRKATKNKCYTPIPEHCEVWCLVATPVRYTSIKMVAHQVKGQLFAKAIPTEIAFTHLKKIGAKPSIATYQTLPAQKCMIPYILPKSELPENIEAKAVYKDIIGKQIEEKDHWKGPFEMISCGGGVSAYTIKEIQEALITRGYQIKATNILNDATKKALLHFQKANDLPQGQLDLETLKKLELF